MKCKFGLDCVKKRQEVQNYKSTNTGELISPVYDKEKAERGIKNGVIDIEIIGEINNQQAIDEQVLQNKVEEVLIREANEKQKQLLEKITEKIRKEQIK